MEANEDMFGLAFVTSDPSGEDLQPDRPSFGASGLDVHGVRRAAPYSRVDRPEPMRGPRGEPAGVFAEYERRGA